MSKKKQRKQKKRQRRLAMQFTPVILVCLALAILISGFTMVEACLSLYVREKNHSFQNAAKYIRSELYEVTDLAEMLDFWHDNYESMDLDWDYDTEYNDKVAQLDAQEKSFKSGTLTTEEAMDYLSLKYAVAYKDFQQMFNQQVNVMGVRYLYLILPDEDGNEFFYISGLKDSDSYVSDGGEIYGLGYIQQVDPSSYPEMYKVLKTGEDDNGMDITIDLGKKMLARYHTYLPVVADGEVKAIIGITIDYNEVFTGTLIRSVLKQEMVAAIIILVGIALSMLILNRKIVAPVLRLQKLVSAFAGDKNQEELHKNLKKIRADNEIGALSEDIDNLGLEMIRYTHEIEEMTQKSARINAELSLGRSIQKQVLQSDFPVFPENPEFDLYASSTPAKEIGGDFYDFFKLDEDHLVLIIADVSGKGIPAALVMFSTMQILRARISDTEHLAEAIAAVNNDICSKNMSDMFVTAWVGILTISTGCITAVNAGHEYPVISKVGEPFAFIRDKHGMVLGGMEGMRYRAYEIQLQPGDRLFFYTDGIPEAIDAQEQAFGNDRMLEQLNRNPGLDPIRQSEDMLTAIVNFRGEAEQFDDITMLAIRYNGLDKIKNETR